VSRFLRDESGATAVEYGLIVSLIFLAIMTALGVFGSRASAMYDDISAKITI